MKKELENYEKWLVKHDRKKESSANSYKLAIPKLEEHYEQFTGKQIAFFNLAELELESIAEKYRQQGIYSEFGDKSNGTYRNALNALIRYKKWLINNKKTTMIEKIKNLLSTEHFQNLLKQEEFYYQKLTNLYTAYREFDTSSINLEISKLLENKTGKFSFQNLLDNAKAPLKEYLLLIGKMIAIFDEKGYNKSIWNPYTDKRNVARGMLRQNLWTKHFLTYKLNEFDENYLNNETPNTFKHSINFINSPETNLNIVSKSYRNDIIEFFNLSNENKLLDLFSDALKNLVNPKNKGIIISQLLYNSEIKDEWLSSIIGLMASDGTGWLSNFAMASEKHEYNIVWNSKRPTGTTDTLKALRNTLDNGDTFNIYYTSKGFIQYAATVIDFVEDENSYNLKSWNSKYGDDIYEYQPFFTNYVDGNKKAGIVFLCSDFNKTKPISVEEFKIYGNYSLPTQDNLSPIKSEPNFEVEEITTNTLQEEEKVKLKKVETTNQILYGPPGTGKTYATKKLTVDIVYEEDENRNREEIIRLYDELVKQKQVVFTTFHQSMSYEDFVEGIKPKTEEKKVTYNVEDGIFKELAIEASYSIAQEIKKEHITKTVSFSNIYDNYITTVSEILERNENIKLLTKSGSEVNIVEISQQGNLILKHQNGSTKYTVSKERLSKLNSSIPTLEVVTNIHDEFRNVIGGSNASVYWAVLNKLHELKTTNRSTEKNVNLSKEEKLTIINTLSKKDYKNATGKPYILIIDEINRGNVSAIFGELITLLEPDKRLGQKEEITVTLPYSKSESKFGIPPNLHIIGTMNTADRSVEALDTALRRRFTFQETPPNSVLTKTVGLSGQVKGIVKLKNNIDLDLEDLLNKINGRIEKLIDKDHKIGHSYFLKVNDETTLKFSFKNNIIPLLEEYFFGDYGKIGLVLGDSFVDVENKDFNFASFKHYDSDVKEDLKERTVFKIKEEELWEFDKI